MPKKVVNNIIYDTEKAELVETWRDRCIEYSKGESQTFLSMGYYRGIGGPPDSDVELYRSSNGSWFFCKVDRGLFSRQYTHFCPADEKAVYQVMHDSNKIELLKRFFSDRLREA